MSITSLGILRNSEEKHNRGDVKSLHGLAICFCPPVLINSLDMRWLKRIAAAVVMVYLAIAAVVWMVVSLPPARFAAIMSKLPTSGNPGPLFMIIPIGPLMMLARAGHLHSGDPAPDFRLRVLHSQETVQLASFRDRKPVALIFGSYT